MRRTAWAAWLLALLPATARAETPSGLAVAGLPEAAGPWGLLLSVNFDDDDGNRRLDLRQSPPAAEDDDVRRVRVQPPAGTTRLALEARGGERFRVHAGDRLLALPAEVASAEAAELALDGRSASAAAADTALRIRFLDAAGVELGATELPLTVVGVAFLDGADKIIDPAQGSLQFSHEIANDTTLPRGAEPTDVSADPDNLRVEAYLEALPGAVIGVRAAAPGAATPRSELAELPQAQTPGAAVRSPFLRLVSDTMDWTAPGVARQVLRADLRDVVTAWVRATDGQVVSTDLRVGRPGDEDGPEAARLARWTIHFLRLTPGGPLAVGVDEATARKIAEDQVRASNEIYAVCNITFGDPAATPVTLDDPPGATLLAVSDIDGLTSAGGEIRFRVNGTAVGPIAVGANWPPHRTAATLGLAVEAAGFRAEVSENAPVDYGAGRSADVLILDAEGRPARIEPPLEGPLTTDRRQSLVIGDSDLTDRLSEFDNATSSAGTLEERTMIKPLADHDPRTIDLFVVNGFAGGGRQGEAFIEHDNGMIMNALVLDRTGIRQTRQAWTQSHEAGHVLLDDPYHPDNFGPDRPWLLMDADASRGAVDGPKRLTVEECERIHRESGLGASPALLERWDETPPDRRLPAEDVPIELGYPRP